MVILCAHYDTKIDTLGALDNAAGIAAMLGLAEQLTRRKDLSAGLECIAFSNEEYLPLGDDAYLACVGEEHLKQVRLVINYDGLGNWIDANSLSLYACSPALTELVQAISQRFPGVQWVDPWPESNHSTFAWRGVPALAISSQSAKAYSHQHDDSPRWVSPKRIAEAISLTEQVIDAIQSYPNAWLRVQNAA